MEQELERRQCGIKIAEMKKDINYAKEDISEIKNCINEIKKDIKRLIPQIAKLEVKASIWGGLSGLIVAIIAIVTQMILFWKK